MMNVKITQSLSGNLYVVTKECAEQLQNSEGFGEWIIVGETDEPAPRTADSILCFAVTEEDMDEIMGIDS